MANQEPYAHDPKLFYPGHRLSDDERARMDAYEIDLADVTIDHLVYSMGRQIELNFQTFYSVAEEVVGEEKALEIAYEIGRRYGGQGYAKFLAARGEEGSPRMMALYQDLVHSIRGPKHISALYAEHDERRCVVRRRQCVYYNEERPENGKYTGAFEGGCFEGYKAADPNLREVEVVRCRYRGDADCLQHWHFGPAEADEA